MHAQQLRPSAAQDAQCRGSVTLHGVMFVSIRVHLLLDGSNNVIDNLMLLRPLRLYAVQMRQPYHSDTPALDLAQALHHVLVPLIYHRSGQARMRLPQELGHQCGSPAVTSRPTLATMQISECSHAVTMHIGALLTVLRA